MNPFSFSGLGAVSFGIDRVKQLADDITALNGSWVPVILISDAGVAKAGILARVLQKQAATILQPALGRSGGILEIKKIAGLAEAHYAQIAPHLYCGPVEGAANIQIGTCSPNFLIQEGIETWGGFHAEILKKPIQWEDGYIIPPTGPGLGVELDEAVAARHPYTGKQLHLEMLDRPVMHIDD